MTVVYTAYEADGQPNVRIIARGRTCMFQLPIRLGPAPRAPRRYIFGHTCSISAEGALRCVDDWRAAGHRVVQTIGEPIGESYPLGEEPK